MKIDPFAKKLEKILKMLKEHGFIELHSNDPYFLSSNSENFLKSTYIKETRGQEWIVTLDWQTGRTSVSYFYDSEANDVF